MVDAVAFDAMEAAMVAAMEAAALENRPPSDSDSVQDTETSLFAGAGTVMGHHSELAGAVWIWRPSTNPCQYQCTGLFFIFPCEGVVWSALKA